MMNGDRRDPRRPRARYAHGLLLAVLGVLASGGCNRAVVRVQASPSNPETPPVITIEEVPQRDNRWSLKKGESVDIVATWPEGEQVRARLAVERDVLVVLRRDGKPNSDDRYDGWLRAASGPRGQAHLKSIANKHPDSDDDPNAASKTDPKTAKGDPQPQESPQEPKKPTTEEVFAQARTLFSEGQQAFELADYDLAIKRYKKAYELIRQSPTKDTAEILTNVIYNLAVVYEKSYELTPEPGRLRRARIMYRQYDEQMADLAENWDSSNEASEVRARVRALDTRINALPAGK